MKKILFVMNSLGNGGAERALVNLLKYLPKDEWQITLFTMYFSGVHESALDKRIKYKYLFKKGKRIKNKFLVWFFCRFFPKKLLYRLAIREKFDYEIAFMQGFSSQFIISSNNKKSKKVTFVHSDFSTNFDVKKLYKSNRECLQHYQRFNKVCFVSKTAQKGFFNSIGKLNNSCVVHNIVDTNNITEQAREVANIPFDKKVIKIIAVGRLVSIKAFDRVIRLIRDIVHQHNVECWIIGDGPEKEELSRLIELYNLSEIVHLLGYQKNPYKFMKNADLYVHSSKSEAYSSVVVESIFLGVPVLTTDVAGMKEIIKDSGCGVIVHNSDEGLLCGLKDILENKRLNEMKIACETRAKDFNIQSQLLEFTSAIDG